MNEFMATVRRATIALYNQTHWFTDKEAWWIFRLGAFMEATGWTLLISAIIYRSFDLPLDDTFITIAGRIHGIFFVCYFAGVLATARSMGWGFWRFMTALVVGVPPFTSLVFEQVMAWHRKKHPVVVAPPKALHE